MNSTAKDSEGGYLMKCFSVITAADAFILEKIFQRFSNLFQRMTGKNCFFLAKTFFILASTLFGLALIIFFTLYRDTGLLFSLTFASGVWVFMGEANALGRKENDISDNPKCYMNEAAETGFIPRMIYWVCLLFSFCLTIATKECKVSFAAMAIAYIFGVIAIYFASCTPLPPGKSLIKKLIESVGKLFSKKSFVPCPANEYHHA
jgi:magnesium-transporting ATPase (P-type)